MLNLRKVLGAKPKEHVKAELVELLTPWGESLDVQHVLEEHPTPQFARTTLQTLNGLWDCAFVASGHDPAGDLEAVVAQAVAPGGLAVGAMDVHGAAMGASSSAVGANPGAGADSNNAKTIGGTTGGESVDSGSIAGSGQDASTYANIQSIVVPFSPEAPLSRVRRQLQPDELLWYRRTFNAPALCNGERCLLHFQAVDYACAIRVNGQLVGTHVGGYTPFTFDITDALTGVGGGGGADEYESAGEGAGKGVGGEGVGGGTNAGSESELLVCVADPSEFGNQLRGKQRFDRGDIWYTAQSGIWQTVWLEVVPAAHIEQLRIEADPSTGILAMGVRVMHPYAGPNSEASSRADDRPGKEPACESGNANKPNGVEAHSLPNELRLEVFGREGRLVASAVEPVETTHAHNEPAAAAVAVHIPSARMWSPKDPYLYQIRVTYGDDVVSSYCGFRSVEMRADAGGHRRVYLNGRPLFIKGVLDQAYWSDGLLTAPSDKALVFDIEAMRDAGFNLMRKHIKVECARWYYHCDRLGMLVLQDMVQGGAGAINAWQWSYKPTLFKASWGHYRDDLASHREQLGSGSATYRREWVDTCREAVRLLGNSPCIIGWSLFNEGWGQFDAKTMTSLIRSLDPTRVIDAVSGWYDQGCGDFRSVHNYFRELAVWPCRHGRAFLISEFGGFSHRVEGHSSLADCYGYEVYDDLEEWRAAVRKLLADADALEQAGLAGYVYTQVSDVEEETNGLLTYDRRVNKLAGQAKRHT